MEKSISSPSIFGGASIIAAICIGAGMLGLPIAGSGGWFFWSIAILLLTMIMMTLSGSMLMESLKGYKANASYSTVTKDILGRRVCLLNNLAVYFVGFIILYAYITTMGSLFSSIFSMDSKILSLVSVISLSAIVWHSTKSVDRVSVLLIVFMIVSFLLLTSDLITYIDTATLFNKNDNSYASKSWILLPVALTSFGYHHSISSMRNYYGDEKRAVKAIVTGTTIALTFYCFWIFCIFGNLSRDSFVSIIESGGNVDTLLSTLSNKLDKNNFENIVFAFSLSAVVSSFIGVGLGLFDFIADCFGLRDDVKGRTKTWGLTFIPPLMCSLFFPFGFITAIGYAGAIATIWTCIIPAILLFKSREKNNSSDGFRVPGGVAIIVAVIIFGFCTMVSHFLNMLDLLPSLGK